MTSPRIKFQVVDCRGKVHTRTSNKSIYTHCVVVQLKGKTKSKVDIPPGAATEWVRTVTLAENVAARWLRAREWRNDIGEIEILGAERVS